MDLRPADKIARIEQTGYGDFEGDAARVVHRLTGAPVFLQDDGSHDRMVDIRIEYADGRFGWVEVCAPRGEAEASLRSQLLGKRQNFPPEWPAPDLRRAWSVTVSGESDLRRVKKELGAILQAMETAGEMFGIVATHVELLASQSPSVQQLVALGVQEVSSCPAETADGGVIRLYLPMITGPLDLPWEPFVRWIEATLSSPSELMVKHREKLAAMTVGERHFFLGVAETSSALHRLE